STVCDLFAILFVPSPLSFFSSFFFFNHTAPTAIYSLSLHDALPISLSLHDALPIFHQQTQNQRYGSSHIGATAKDISNVVTDERSEERFSRNAETDLVCRLLLEKKKEKRTLRHKKSEKIHSLRLLFS